MCHDSRVRVSVTVTGARDTVISVACVSYLELRVVENEMTHVYRK
jgi:hypothetical protein